MRGLVAKTTLVAALVAVGYAAAKPAAPSKPPPATAPAKPAAKSFKIAALAPGQWSGKQGNVPEVVHDGWGHKGLVLVKTTDTLFRSTDNGLTWEGQPSPGRGAIWGLSPSKIFVSGSQLAESTDGGKTWQTSKPFPKGTSVDALWGPKESELYGVTSSSAPALVYSKDGGKTFTKASAGISDGYLYDVVGDGKDVFVMGKKSTGELSSVGVLLKTQDKGKSFKKLKVPTVDGEAVPVVRKMCFTSKGRMFVITDYDVFMSDNRAQSWKLALPRSKDAELLGLACRGQEVYFGGRGAVFGQSKDNGKTWDVKSLSALWGEKIASTIESVFTTPTGAVYATGEGTYNPMNGSVFRLAK
jgi:photosystem II stability/assembly factor-like uncharacterized protein